LRKPEGWVVKNVNEMNNEESGPHMRRLAKKGDKPGQIAEVKTEVTLKTNNHLKKTRNCDIVATHF
jgi:hypothetical protein